LNPKVSRLTKTIWAVRFLGLLPLLVLGAVLIPVGYQIYFIVVFFWLVLLMDVYLVRWKLSSEAGKVAGRMHWNGVWIVRLGAISLSILLPILSFMALSLFGLVPFLLSLALGVGLAWITLRLTKH